MTPSIAPIKLDQEWSAGAMVGVYLGLFFILASAELDIVAQLVFVAASMGTMIVLRFMAPIGPLRVVFLTVALLISARYFGWRITDTIDYVDPISLVAAIALLLAEAYGFIIAVLGAFVTVHHFRRHLPITPLDETQAPSVDILIPSYNEDPELLEVTMLAARAIVYPGENYEDPARSRKRVYLLDDGGTIQRRNHADPEIRQAAEERYHTLRALCRKVGVTYLTRERNVGAKAGNLNAALPKVHGDYVLILDADHVPTADILQNTVPLLNENPKLFLVQTPHFFLNPDPLERNLGTFREMPSEQEMFYGVIQRGLDYWDGSFFCGSAALLRRKHLDEVGGIQGESITEDAETALELHAKGYHSAYVDKPMVAGLAPETFSAFISQRIRWAQGMIQIFLLKNPLFKKGLSITQRLCYLNSSFFWFFPMARLMFYLAPVLYLVFNVSVYNATSSEIVAYTIPHVIASLMMADYLYRRVRWLFISELYELVQSVFCFRGLLKVFANPRAPEFVVTPKGEVTDRDYISPLAGWFYVIFFAAVLAQAFGIQRAVVGGPQSDILWAVLTWNFFNIMLALGAIGVVYERLQRRTAMRAERRYGGYLKIGNYRYPFETLDVSVSGARLTVSNLPEDRVFPIGTPVSLSFSILHEAEIKAELRQPLQAGQPCGVRYAIGDDPLQRLAAVHLVHADSSAWEEFTNARARRSVPGGRLLFLMRRSTEVAWRHFVTLIRFGKRQVEKWYHESLV